MPFLVLLSDDVGINFILFSLECLWTSSIKIGNFFHFSVEERLSSSMVVGSLSYYPPSVPIFITTVIEATSNIL
jgi:hypothetical protein